MARLKFVVGLWLAVLSAPLCWSAVAQAIVVGAKEFTEQLLLAELTTQLLVARGYDVHKGTGFGTEGLRALQQSGQQRCQRRTCIYAAPQIAAGARNAVFGSRARAQRCALVEHEPDDARRGPDGLGAGAVVGAERVARRRTGPVPSAPYGRRIAITGRRPPNQVSRRR